MIEYLVDVYNISKLVKYSISVDCLKWENYEPRWGECRCYTPNIKLAFFIKIVDDSTRIVEKYWES